MNQVVIRIENLSKKFKIFHEPPLTLQKAAYNFIKGKKNYQDVWALQDINLAIDKGESVGLIGPNASGKTTMMRLIAGIYQPSNGAVRVSGRLAPFMELGAGFNMEFTGIDNLYLYGAIFGLSRKELGGKIEAIRDFSELKDFLDVPMRQYSFGMRMRLAFSLAVNINPDILLIDEMLAVGDLAFKEKCFQKMKELQIAGKTLLLVSHHMEEIKKLCQRVIFINGGRIKFIGPVDQAIEIYRKLG